MKRLTNQQYDMAKALLNAGLNKTKTGEIAKLSANTVGIIGQSTDMADYRRITAERWKKYRQPATSYKMEPKFGDSNAILLNLCEMVKQVREAQDLHTQRLEKLIDAHPTIQEAKLARVGLFGKR